MTTPLRFCQYCGTPIKPDDDFCHNCGFDLRTARLTAQTNSENEASTPTPHTTPAYNTAAAPAHTRHTPHTHRRWPWIVGIVDFLIAGCAVLAGAAVYSTDRTVAELAEEMNSGDADDMAEVAVASDGTPLHEDDRLPLATHFEDRHYRSLLNTMIRE